MYIYPQLRLTLCGVLFSCMAIIMGCADEMANQSVASHADDHRCDAGDHPTEDAFFSGECCITTLHDFLKPTMSGENPKA